MSIFLSVVLVVQVLSALAVIVLVLLQHGKGADMGASFGAGASGSLFGSTGSANFLSRTTGVLAAIFFASTLALAFVANQRGAATGSSVLDRVAPAKEAPKSDVPKTDAPATDAPKADTKIEVKPADKPTETKPVQNNEVPK